MDEEERAWLRLKVAIASQFGIQPSEVEKMSVEEVYELIRMLGEIEQKIKMEEAMRHAVRRI